MPQPSSLGPIRQVAFITRDIKQSMHHFAKNFDIGPWFYEPQIVIESCTYRGTRQTLNIAAGIANSGSMQFEFIQPNDNSPSVYREFLAKYPDQPQVQHLCVWVDDIGVYEGTMTEKGYSMVQKSCSGMGNIVYLSHPDFPDICLELADLTPARAKIYQAIETAAIDWNGTDPVRQGFPID